MLKNRVSCEIGTGCSCLYLVRFRPPRTKTAQTRSSAWLYSGGKVCFMSSLNFSCFCLCRMYGGCFLFLFFMKITWCFSLQCCFHYYPKESKIPGHSLPCLSLNNTVRRNTVFFSLYVIIITMQNTSSNE